MKHFNRLYLLGAIVALMAMPFSALSADAPINSDPDPVEYVKVCDAYGAGWFFIPGTERCLKMSGDVHVEYGAVLEGGDESHAGYRARVNFYARNEVEIGTVVSRIRLTSEMDGIGMSTVLVDEATISILAENSGIKTGYGDHYWGSSGGFSLAQVNGYYGSGNALYFQAFIPLEASVLSAGVQIADGNATDDADFYGGVTAGFSGIDVSGAVIYDNSIEDLAWKVSGEYIDVKSGLGIGGWYMSATDIANEYVTGTTAYGVWASIAIKQFELYGGYTASNGADDYASVGARWNVSDDLYISPEYMTLIAGGGSAYNIRMVRSF